MEFTSSYFHAFGNPDFAAVFSGGGSAQAIRPPRRSVDGGARAAEEEECGGASPASARRAPSMFCVPDTEAEEPNRFLDECTLCRKALCGDIFMYRGDTPFCSDECRREQMETDRVRHRRKKQHAIMLAQQQAAAMAAAHRPQRQLQPQH
ncbi:unnamed protein product [Urochloa humidicola]